MSRLPPETQVIRNVAWYCRVCWHDWWATTAFVCPRCNSTDIRSVK